MTRPPWLGEPDSDSDNGTDKCGDSDVVGYIDDGNGGDDDNHGDSDGDDSASDNYLNSDSDNYVNDNNGNENLFL